MLESETHQERVNDRTTNNPAQRIKPAVLVSASFGPVINIPNVPPFDVTEAIKKLIAKERSNRLVLRPPPPLRNGKGRLRKPPTTLQCWYIRHFGDPCPGLARLLVLKIRDKNTGRRKTLEFPENSLVDIPLCVFN
ncbi:hypothetical protein ACA910_012162 [Epithemia clementina (nom. ined.)]